MDMTDFGVQIVSIETLERNKHPIISIYKTGCTRLGVIPVSTHLHVDVCHVIKITNLNLNGVLYSIEYWSRKI
jgi:hypothetical protein